MAKDLGTLYVGIRAKFGKFTGDLNRAKTHAMSTSQTMIRHFNLVKGAIIGLAGAAGIGLIGRSIIRMGADFERSMATVRGVMRATDKEFSALQATALEMGETTEWTSSQSAEALKFLGMAGFNASKAMKALPGTLDLATAGNIDLGRAADIATNALTAMQLPVEQLGMINDTFIATITRSNTNMEMMAESFRYAAPVAQAYGMDIQRLSALIGVLGNAGVQGSMAGTQLAFSFQKVGSIFKKLGMSGTGKDLIDALEGMNRAGWDSQKVLQAVGMRGGRAALILRQLIPEVRELEEKIRAAKGESKELADTMRNTVIGAWRELKSAIESISIRAFTKEQSALGREIRNVTKSIRESKDAFIEMAAAIVSATTKLAKFISLRSVMKTFGEGMKYVNEGLLDFNKFVKAGFYERQRMIDQVRALKNETKAYNEELRKRPEYAGLPGLSEEEKRKRPELVESQAQKDFDKAMERFKKMQKIKKDLKNITDESILPANVDPIFSDLDKFFQVQEDHHQKLVDDWKEYENVLKEAAEAQREFNLALYEPTKLEVAVGEAPQKIIDMEKERQETIKKENEKTFKYLTDLSERTAWAMQDNFSTLFYDAMKGEMKSFEDYMTSIFDSILKAFADMAAQMAVEGLFGSLTKATSGGGAAVAAKGLAFDRSGIMPFGAGGIVNRPTIFPFASGIGMMAEKGPEAIMPLKRTASGELGVRAEGGSGKQTNVNFNIYAIDTQSGTQFLIDNAPAIATAINSELESGNQSLIGNMRMVR